MFNLRTDNLKLYLLQSLWVKIKKQKKQSIEKIQFKNNVCIYPTPPQWARCDKDNFEVE